MNTYQGFNRSPVDILPAPLGSSTNVVPTEDAPRQKRTRAKRSCDMCRKKKSKCDAEVNRPCTNCKNWKTECVFLVEQKKRGPSTGHVSTLISYRCAFAIFSLTIVVLQKINSVLNTFC
jgi:hypothetical protein